MSQLILASAKSIEFNKKFKTQIILNNTLIISNVVIWLAAIFLLGSCGSPVHATRHHSPLDKGEYTSMQCLKISKARHTLAKRPLKGHQSIVSARVHNKYSQH